MATAEWGADELLLTWARKSEEYLHEEVTGGRIRPNTWFDVSEGAKKEEGCHALLLAARY
jgi:hypothetical protein